MNVIFIVVSFFPSFKFISLRSEEEFSETMPPPYVQFCQIDKRHNLKAATPNQPTLFLVNIQFSFQRSTINESFFSFHRFIAIELIKSSNNNWSTFMIADPFSACWDHVCQFYRCESTNLFIKSFIIVFL